MFLKADFLLLLERNLGRKRANMLTFNFFLLLHIKFILMRLFLDRAERLKPRELYTYKPGEHYHKQDSSLTYSPFLKGTCSLYLDCFMQVRREVLEDGLPTDSNTLRVSGRV
jgi:hypothetical protein